MRCREMQLEASSPAETEVLVPKVMATEEKSRRRRRGGDGGESSRGEAEGRRRESSRERERDGNDAGCLEARQISP